MASVSHGSQRSAAALIDTSTSFLQIGPKDHRSVVVDDGEALKAAKEAAGVGDGDDRPTHTPSENATAPRLQASSKGHGSPIVHRRPQWANAIKRASGIRNGDHLTVTDPKDPWASQLQISIKAHRVLAVDIGVAGEVAKEAAGCVSDRGNRSAVAGEETSVASEWLERPRAPRC